MSSPRNLARAASRRNHRSGRRTVRKLRTFTGRIYVASPIQTYGTPRYAAMVARLREVTPHAELLLARDIFISNSDWRARWPALLPTIDALVFFDDDDGCIGAGTERELADAWLAGIPVYFLPPAPLGTLIPCDERGEVQFWPVLDKGPRQTQRVCYAVSLDDALALLKGDD